MKNTEKAFKWIIGILKKHEVPFQITGGLAAKVYGSNRPLADIDIDIPDDDFPKIMEDVNKFIVYGPAHYNDERWDCKLMTLSFEGQEIDISGADSMKICDARTGEWKSMPTDFLKSVEKEVFGISVPVIPPKALVDYKQMLIGEHQREDIASVSAWISQ
ncbi:MAG: hypothetical protein Q7S09_05525 [bacterium]|nr:hypothetical protein [bacterium]